MALFEGFRRDATRPNMNMRLVVSGGDSPAEKWIVDQSLQTLVNYPYGGAGQTDVIVTKGMLVSPTGSTVRDYETGRQISEITIAKGVSATGVGLRLRNTTTDGLSSMGMAPYNFSRQIDNQLTGNLPAIITREYVELPYIPNATDAGGCVWGLVHGGGVKTGDYLMVSPLLPGKLTRWTNDYSTTEIVGQVLGINDTGSANAWMEWAMWDESKRKEDTPGTLLPAPGDSGFPFDPEIFRGTQGTGPYLSQYTTTPQGIPGITDGSKIRETLFENVTIAFVPKNTTAGTRVIWYNPQKNLTQIQVRLGATDITAGCQIDMVRGWIEYTITPADVTALAASQAGLTVTTTYKAKQHGTPSYWDFTGSVGAVRLLLKY